jgi:hypothetical protein
MGSTITLTKVANTINVATVIWPHRGTLYCGYLDIKSRRIQPVYGA